MCRSVGYGYNYFNYWYCYPQYNRSVDCYFLDLKLGGPIKIITCCVVKIGIFICTDGRLLTWVDNAGNKSFSLLNHITVTKVYEFGIYCCLDECSNDDCIVE
ncbi:hypothetical protein [Bacillus mycoides]|uniref:hypothetical protein n=1 Tax=Bacillus mycoides TaxID=1405 RepID=UPI003A800047